MACKGLMKGKSKGGALLSGGTRTLPPQASPKAKAYGLFGNKPAKILSNSILKGGAAAKNFVKSQFKKYTK